MTEFQTPEREKLRAELDEALKILEGFEGELRTVDAELEDLATERLQHELVQDVCGSLDKLEELGGSDLFWRGASETFSLHNHLPLVRRRIDDFNRRLGDLEARRQSILESIHGKQEHAEILEDDIYEIRRQEEQKKLEWVIEREMDESAHRLSIMPWSREGEDDERFRRTLAVTLLLSLLLGLLLPMIDLPIPERATVIELPDRLARLIKEVEPPPPPPVQAETRPEEELAAEEEPETAESPEPKPEMKKANEKPAGSKGILAFREKFSQLAESRPSALLGAKARINRAGESSSSRSERSLVTTQGPGSSRGINLAALSRNLGGGGGEGLEGVEVTQATSSIGATDGQGRPLSDGPGPARTDEEIQIVFDRHKSALYRLYNRELRQDPTLKGQMVLRFTIEPDGTVSLCEVKSSDMKAPNLAAQVVERVKTFDFGAKEGVGPVTILYPIDFLPAT